MYLARLIFQMPQNKSTKFMESVIFTLYNYASNPREAYLLLQLFKVALQEEIRWVSLVWGQAQGKAELHWMLLPLLSAASCLENTHIAGPCPHPICPISASRSKVDNVHDILTGNATVIRLVVSFYRNARGQNALRHILAGPVQEVLQDKTLSIRTDPVDIYKAWINQTESQSGHRRSDPG